MYFIAKTEETDTKEPVYLHSSVTLRAVGSIKPVNTVLRKKLHFKLFRSHLQFKRVINILAEET